MYRSTHQTARAIARIVAFFGWLTVIGAVIVIGSAVPEYSDAKRDPERGAVLVKCAFALGAFIAGVLQVAMAQLIRAIVDTADHTGEMLAIMKTQRTV